MKRLSFWILVLFLAISISGCGDNKPSENDVIKSCNKMFAPMDNLLERLNKDLVMSDYVECEDVKIVDSFKKGDIYVLQVIPHIEFKKDFNSEVLKNYKIQPNSQVGGTIMDTMSFLKGLQLYNEGKIKKGQISQRLKYSDIIFKSGDNFDGLKSNYKFRKTDNGWLDIQ